MAKIKIDIDQLQDLKVDTVLYLSICKNREKVNTFSLGIHGYVLCKEIEKKKTGDKPGKFTITDIGYIDNDIKANYPDKEAEIPSFYFNYAKTINESTIAGIMIETLKSIGDLVKVKILEKIKEEYEKLEVLYQPYTIDKLVILTNSSMFLNIVNEENIESLAVLLNNPSDELMKMYDVMLSSLLTSGNSVSINSIPNYETNIGLNIASGLALYQIMNQQDELLDLFFRDRIKFWDIKENVHPLLRFRQLFFTNQSDTDKFLSVMEYPTNKTIGSRSSSACFGVVECSDTTDLIKESIDIYKDYTNPLSVLCTVDLKNLFCPDNIRNSWSMGKHRYEINRHGILKTLTGEDIIYPVLPSGLATKVYDSMSRLHSILDNYKNNRTGKTLTFVDITHDFFQEDEKGNLNFTIPQGQNDLLLKIQAYDNTLVVPIELGKDCIYRNSLKHLEKEHPKITLVLEKGKDSTIVNYYTIVECDKGIGIYCNFYSGKIILSS